MSKLIFGAVPKKVGRLLVISLFLFILNILGGMSISFSMTIAVITGMTLGPIMGSLVVGTSYFVVISTQPEVYLPSAPILLGVVVGTFIMGLTSIMEDPDEGCGKRTFIGWLVCGGSLPFSIAAFRLYDLFPGSIYLYEFVQSGYYLVFGLSFIGFIVGGVIRMALTLKPKSSTGLVDRIPKEQTRVEPIRIDTSGEEDLPSLIPDAASPQVSYERSEQVVITSGVDMAGESLKVAIKIMNNMEYSITDVTVNMDAPDGLDFAQNSSAVIRIGSISPNGGFQSAIYWLKPNRCIDDTYGGNVTYQTAHGDKLSLNIPRKRLVNICPMLEETESPREIFTQCKYGGLERNSAAFKFQGDPAMAFRLAMTRLSSLTPAEKIEQNVGENNYLAYACVVGKTKYTEKSFAAEVQISGTKNGGILTVNIYSDDTRILSGFFVDIMTDVRQHITILEENSEVRPTQCPNCSAPLNLSNLDESRIYECEACGSRGVVPSWMV